MKLLNNCLNHFFTGIELDWKVKGKVVILFLIALIFCITNVIK